MVGRDLFLRTAALRGSLLLATAVATRIGTVDVAAHQIAFEIWSFLALVLDALAIAGQSMIGRFLGAGSAVEARAAGRRLLEWGVGRRRRCSAWSCWCCDRGCPSCSPTTPPWPTLAGFLLLWVAVLQPVNGVVFVLDGLLIGAGDMAFLAWAMWIAFGVFATGAVAVLVLGLGIGWLWACLAALMLSRLTVLGLRWRTDGWAVTGAAR